MKFSYVLGETVLPLCPNVRMTIRLSTSAYRRTCSKYIPEHDLDVNICETSMDDSRDTVIMRVPDEQLEGEDFIKFFSKAGTIKVIEILHCILYSWFMLQQAIVQNIFLEVQVPT